MEATRNGDGDGKCGGKREAGEDVDGEGEEHEGEDDADEQLFCVSSLSSSTTESVAAEQDDIDAETDGETLVSRGGVVKEGTPTPMPSFVCTRLHSLSTILIKFCVCRSQNVSSSPQRHRKKRRLRRTAPFRSVKSRKKFETHNFRTLKTRKRTGNTTIRRYVS